MGFGGFSVPSRIKARVTHGYGHGRRIVEVRLNGMIAGDCEAYVQWLLELKD